MIKHAAALFTSLYQHRELIGEMSRRDILGRYRGSILGILWSLVQPLIMLAIYTFVFSLVFKARWTGDEVQSKLYFAINLFAGLIVFNVFAECITRAPNAILSQANFVTRVIFPLEIIPVIPLVSALFHAVISLSVLFCATFLALGRLPMTTFLLPLVLIPLILFVLGLSWFLSATGVYLRDIGQTISLIVTGLMFISPVFFPISALPPRWQFIAEFNPLSFPIEQTRHLLILGIGPDWEPLLIYTAFALFVSWAGFACFQKLRNGFADVI